MSASTATVNCIFNIARQLERKNVRGSTALIKLLTRFGLLDKPVTFGLGDAISFEMSRKMTPWDAQDIANYEWDFLKVLVDCAHKLPRPLTFIDVGGDIGLFSMKFAAAFPRVSHLVAFEPNPDAFAWLERNLETLHFRAEAIPQGLADYSGRARLVTPQGGDHAANFVERVEDGPISITTLDAITISPGSVCLKVDVEGGELAVLRGAEKTLRSATGVAIGIEAHPDVVKRTGIDPVNCLRLLASWRPFSFTVAETGLPLTESTAVFEQIEPNRVYNIVGISAEL